MLMPKVSRLTCKSLLPDNLYRLVRRCLTEDSRIRIGFHLKHPVGGDEAAAYYIWRWVVFFTSPYPRHHCKPTSCFHYLGQHFQNNANAIKIETVLDKVVKVILASIVEKGT